MRARERVFYTHTHTLHKINKSNSITFESTKNMKVKWLKYSLTVSFFQVCVCERQRKNVYANKYTHTGRQKWYIFWTIFFYHFSFAFFILFFLSLLTASLLSIFSNDPFISYFHLILPLILNSCYLCSGIALL